MTRAALALSTLFLLQGCVFTNVVGALARVNPPPQTARVVATRDADGRPVALNVVVTETGVGSPRSATTPLDAREPLDPERYEVQGGSMSCSCRCWRTAYGLVARAEALSWTVDVKEGATARRVAAVRALPGEPTLWNRLVLAALPLAIAADVALLPFELVFAAVRMSGR